LSAAANTIGYCMASFSIVHAITESPPKSTSIIVDVKPELTATATASTMSGQSVPCLYGETDRPAVRLIGLMRLISTVSMVSEGVETDCIPDK
jgi:hypothetical protein